MKSLFATSILAITCSITVAGQDPVPTTSPEKQAFKGVYVGVGLGQDVGGIIGLRVTYWPTPYFAGFLGGGWVLAGAGYNGGVELHLPGKRRTSPFLVGMYGYNAVIHVQGKESLDGIYYGPTIGGGVMIKQRYDRNYWRLSINYPIRSQEMLDDWEVISARPDVEVKSDLMPITLGVGFHLALF